MAETFKGSLFCKFSDTLFGQKSPALSVPVADGGDTINITRTLQLMD